MISIKATHSILKYIKHQKLQIEKAQDDPQVEIPQSIDEIKLNTWETDEVRFFY